jgi:hypothetical protein
MIHTQAQNAHRSGLNDLTAAKWMPWMRKKHGGYYGRHAFGFAISVRPAANLRIRP